MDDLNRRTWIVFLFSLFAVALCTYLFFESVADTERGTANPDTEVLETFARIALVAAGAFLLAAVAVWRWRTLRSMLRGRHR